MTSRASMRRQVVVVMSGLSVIVVGVSLKSSQHHATSHALGAASIVAATSAPKATVAPAARPLPAGAAPGRTASPARPVATTAPKATATRTARATARPRATATHRPTATAAPSVTINGAAYDTRYGPVQVQITVKAGRITAADAIDYPQSGDRDREINSYAIPQLDQETLSSQSAQIDTVSGATYTSDGYRSSLQSAIDAAHRAGAL